jgi:2-polyprenyl-3-methyl-5-hydroxy-6-metoxy-1,4-benzoquinol methylase
MNAPSLRLPLTPRRHFVKPDVTNFGRAGGHYQGSYVSYSHYNYLRPGLLARLKAHRFEVALQLTTRFFGRGGAIDYGCADGIFLPSLARHFTQVAGIDNNPAMLRTALGLAQTMALPNVRLFNTAHQSVEAIRSSLPDTPWRVLYLLETVEHVGHPRDMYGSRVQFIAHVSQLVDRGGAIVVSVPVMVGLPFGLKYALQVALKMHHEPYTARQLFSSICLSNTSALEQCWSGGHKGFNHQKLESALRSAFNLVQTVSSGTSMFYVLRV